MRDKEGNIVANKSSKIELNSYIDIENVRPWWPYLMNDDVAYLYTMEVRYL